MIHTQLNYLIAQQRAEDLRRTAERERVARSIHADRRSPRRLARLHLTLAARRSVVTSDSMSGATAR